MCQFFSFLSRKDGKKIYANWEVRKQDLTKEWDSHSFLAEYFKNDSGDSHNEDLLNKYEYNPLTQNLIKDSVVFEESEAEILSWAKSLDWKTIVNPLVIKPIINPFDLPKQKVNKKMLQQLFIWNSVWNSARESVGASARESVGASARESVGESVWASARDSARDSVWDSIYGYYSSFFTIQYTYDYSCIIKLWESGIVPSFDRCIWRLHSGQKSEIIWQGTVEDLKKEIN